MKPKPPLTEYIGNNIIADALGVTNSAITNWVKRKITGVPEPDAIIRHRRQTEYIYLASRLDEWRTWYASRKNYQLTKAEQALKRAQERVAALQKTIKES